MKSIYKNRLSIIIMTAIIAIIAGLAIPSSSYAASKCSTRSTTMNIDCPLFSKGTNADKTSKKMTNCANDASTASSKLDPNNIVHAHVLTATVCRVTSIMKGFTEGAWCKISEAFEPVLYSMITLSMICFGIMISLGMIQPGLGEYLGYLLKVVLVWAFATKSELAIDLAYNFFISVMDDGIRIVTTQILTLDYMDGPVRLQSSKIADNDPGSVLDGLDRLFSSIFLSSTPLSTSKHGVSLVGGVLGIQSSVPLGMSIGLFLALSSLYAIFIFIKSVIVFLLSIVGITFLIIMMPIFVMFALFNVTAELFNTWLKAIISYTLQPILLFAFLTMIERNLSNSLEGTACTIQQHVVDCANSRTNRSDGKTSSLMESRYCFAKEPCPTGVNCALVDPTSNWSLQNDWDNDNFIAKFISKIGSGVILLLIINSFLGWIPKLAQMLAGGIVPVLGGTKYSGSSEGVSHGILDGMDVLMSQFNKTAGETFVRYKKSRERAPLFDGNIFTKPQNPEEELEINPYAFSGAFLGSAEQTLVRGGYLNFDIDANDSINAGAAHDKMVDALTDKQQEKQEQAEAAAARDAQKQAEAAAARDAQKQAVTNSNTPDPNPNPNPKPEPVAPPPPPETNKPEPAPPPKTE